MKTSITCFVALFSVFQAQGQNAPVAATPKVVTLSAQGRVVIYKNDLSPGKDPKVEAQGRAQLIARTTITAQCKAAAAGASYVLNKCNETAGADDFSIPEILAKKHGYPNGDIFTMAHTDLTCDCSFAAPAGGQPAAPPATVTQAAAAAGRPCSFNNIQLQDGQGVVAFETPAPPAIGVNCKMERRVCQAGSLTGTFKYLTCVLGGTAATAVGPAAPAAAQTQAPAAQAPAPVPAAQPPKK